MVYMFMPRKLNCRIVNWEWFPFLGIVQHAHTDWHYVMLLKIQLSALGHSQSFSKLYILSNITNMFYNEDIQRTVYLNLCYKLKNAICWIDGPALLKNGGIYLVHELKNFTIWV